MTQLEFMVIMIDGCVGLGKTTLAKGLATIRRSDLILEQFDKNPFLDDFYDETQENAIESEFAFLLLHYRQLKHLTRVGHEIETICDFSFEKNLLYGKQNLRSEPILQIFNTLYNILAADLAEPDLLITLSGTDELVMERIRLRNRVAEQRIDPSYFIKINKAHNCSTSQYRCPKLFVDMNTNDFVKNPSSLYEVSERVNAILNS